MTTVDKAAARTTVPARPGADVRRPQPRQVGTFRTSDVLALVGALAAAFGATGLLWTQLAPFSGILGYIVVTWCLFVLFYAVLVSFDENRPTVRDRVASVVVHSMGALVIVALIDVIYYTAYRGGTALIHLNFYTQDLGRTLPTDPVTKGGVIHAIVGTLIEIAIAIGIAAPLGLLTAVFMHAVPGALARFVRTVVDAMTALPDVLAGLFIYATLVLYFKGFFGAAAACALAITAVPIIARAAYVVLQLVPGNLTEAAYALGSGQWRTVLNVMLPTARSGLATAVILGTARAIGETAPVLLTAGTNNNLNANPLSGPMMSLPLLAYQSAANAFPAVQARGFGAAVTLLALVLVLFVAARKIGGRGPGQLSAGQRRRVAAASRRDLARYARHNAAYTDAAVFGYSQERT